MRIYEKTTDCVESPIEGDGKKKNLLIARKFWLSLTQWEQANYFNESVFCDILSAPNQRRSVTRWQVEKKKGKKRLQEAALIVKA